MDERTDHEQDRLGLDILTPDECWDLMANTAVGRLAFASSGGIDVLPVTHRVVGRRIVFKSSQGSKLDAARMASAVAFEVDDWDPDAHRGWSVLAQGVAESAPEDVAELDASELEPWLEPAAEGTWVQIRVDEITGRRLG